MLARAPTIAARPPGPDPAPPAPPRTTPPLADRSASATAGAAGRKGCSPPGARRCRSGSPPAPRAATPASPHPVSQLAVIDHRRRRRDPEPPPVLRRRRRRAGRDTQRHPALRPRILVRRAARPRPGPVRRIEHPRRHTMRHRRHLAQCQPHQRPGHASIAGGRPVRPVAQKRRADPLALPHRVVFRDHPRRQHQRGHAPEYAMRHRRSEPPIERSGLHPKPRPSLQRGGSTTHVWGCGGRQAPPSIGRPQGCHTDGRAASGTAACTPTAGAALLRTPDRRGSRRSAMHGNQALDSGGRTPWRLLRGHEHV